MNNHELTKKSSFLNGDIISLGIEHVKDCLHLDEIAFNSLWTKQHWQFELTASSRLCIGFLEKQELIALACGSIICDQIDITALGVDPRHRRLGIGNNLLSALLNQARTKGVIIATLEVSEKNKVARNLYKKHGFYESGYRKNYYKDGSGAYLLSLNLDEIQRNI